MKNKMKQYISGKWMEAKEQENLSKTQNENNRNDNKIKQIIN